MKRMVTALLPAILFLLLVPRSPRAGGLHGADQRRHQGSERRRPSRASTSPSRRLRPLHAQRLSDDNGGYVLPNLRLSVSPRGEPRRLSLLRADRHRAEPSTATPAINVVLALVRSPSSSRSGRRRDGRDPQHRRRTADREPARPRAAAQRPPGHRSAPAVARRHGEHLGRFASSRNYPTYRFRSREAARQHGLRDGRRQPQRSRHELQPAGAVPRALQESGLRPALSRRGTAITRRDRDVVTKSGTNQMHGRPSSFAATGGSTRRTRSRCRRTRCGATQFRRRDGRTHRQEQAVLLRRLPGHDHPHGSEHAAGVRADGGMLSGDFTALASPACNSGRQIALRALREQPGQRRRQLDPVALKYLQYIPVSRIPAAGISTATRRRATTISSSDGVDYQRAPGSLSTRATWTSRYKLPTTSTGRTR